ncbi:type II toxin-antitoxin system Phd/YefM family antitoxin [Actinomycetospora sp. OC33-EN08]|uniref:Antitoxin n=1 Tax=Actinomycetospora aurantiaca TaxID=3129233 RepID=A0ABU8MJ12_9PSEU
MSLSDARARLADVVDTARVEHEPVFITRRGRRVAAVIAAEELDRLIAAAEDLADLRAAREAREEMSAGAAPVPWDEVKRELGLA